MPTAILAVPPDNSSIDDCNKYISYLNGIINHKDNWNIETNTPYTPTVYSTILYDIRLKINDNNTNDGIVSKKYCIHLGCGIGDQSLILTGLTMYNIKVIDLDIHKHIVSQNIQKCILTDSKYIDESFMHIASRIHFIHDINEDNTISYTLEKQTEDNKLITLLCWIQRNWDKTIISRHMNIIITNYPNLRHIVSIHSIDEWEQHGLLGMYSTYINSDYNVLMCMPCTCIRISAYSYACLLSHNIHCT